MSYDSASSELYDFSCHLIKILVALGPWDEQITRILECSRIYVKVARFFTFRAVLRKISVRINQIRKRPAWHKVRT